MSGLQRVLQAALPLALTCQLALACQNGEQTEQAPAWVVQQLLERMGAVHGDRDRAKAAYELLWSQAKSNLQERATLASALLGRLVEPEEMLVPSQFSLQFVPKHYTTTLHGDWATVTAHGEAASATREIRCVYENSLWRVVIELPPPRPIEKRFE